MLSLILGVSGTGKSTLIKAAIKKRALNGKKSLLIVPEQFTASTEEDLYQLLGDSLLGYVTSCSFTSLVDKLQHQFGGLATKCLTMSDRVVLIRKAMMNLGENITFYRHHQCSAAFCQMIVETIDELKNAGLTPEKLQNLAQESLLGDTKKLFDIGTIWAASDSLIAQTAFDTNDRILDIAKKMNPAFFADTAVFIDEFDDFNEPKKKLLEQIMIASPEVTVALCCDGVIDKSGGVGIFSGATRIANRLLRIAEKNGIVYAPPTILTEDRRHNADMTALNQVLIGEGEKIEPQTISEITLTSFRSRIEETKAVAAEIRRLVEHGALYKEIVIVCRNNEDYLSALQFECSQAKIPLFFDFPTSLEHVAPAQAVRAALLLLRDGLSTTGLMALLKSGLCNIPDEQQCALENYAFTWRPKSAQWQEEFSRSPEGPKGYGERMGDTEQQILIQAEAGRQYLVPRVSHFLEKARGKDAAEISLQIYSLLISIGADRVISRAAQEIASEGGQGLNISHEMIREWNLVMEMLNQMALLLPNEIVRPTEYDEIFCLLLRNSEVNHIPQTNDAVMCTTAPKMRAAGIKYAFVIGLSEGQFPQNPEDSGLLSFADRDSLIQQGVDMPNFEDRATKEKVYWYKSLTVPSEKLWMSWAEEIGDCTSALKEVVTILSPPKADLQPIDYATTPAAALDYISTHWGENELQTASFWAMLESEKETKRQTDAVWRIAQNSPFEVLNYKSIGDLLGERIQLSPSQVEKFYTCPFAFFLQHVIKLRPRRKAEFSPDISGQMIHWILEQVLRITGENFESTSEDSLRDLTKKLADEFARNLHLDNGSQRIEYLISRIEKNAETLLLFIQQEQKQGLFRPVGVEIAIGNGTNAIPPMELESDGHKIQIIGRIDRVDAMCSGDCTYLRVVDYKSGDKDFRLKNVWCGLDCQMLLYLFALDNGQYHNPVEAGVVYLMTDPAPTLEARNDALQPKTYSTDGLILDNSMVFAGMDRDASGLYVPFRFKKDGSPYASKKIAGRKKLQAIEAHIKELVVEMVNSLYQGKIDAVPMCKTETLSPCKWCDYRNVCCHQDGKNEKLIDFNSPANPFDDEGE